MQSGTADFAPRLLLLVSSINNHTAVHRHVTHGPRVDERTRSQWTVGRSVQAANSISQSIGC